jgi:hypothetical protein
MSTTDEIDKLFADVKVDSPAEPETQVGVPESTPPADAGTPEGEITPQAQAALAQMAAKNEGRGSNGKAGKTPWKSVKDKVKEAAAAAREGAEAETGDGVPDEIPGLTSTELTGEAAEARRAEIEAQKESGKKPRGKKLTEAQKAKADAAKLKAKEKADAIKAKEKEKAKAQKEKENENKKKTAKQEAADRRKKAEEERKAKLEKEKEARRKEREARLVPSVLSRENAATKEACAEDYRLSAPKSDRNPEGSGVRRAKADRGDFTAGWIMATRRIRRDLARQSKGSDTAAQAAG